MRLSHAIEQMKLSKFPIGSHYACGCPSSIGVAPILIHHIQRLRSFDEGRLVCRELNIVKAAMAHPNAN